MLYQSGGLNYFNGGHFQDCVEIQFLHHHYPTSADRKQIVYIKGVTTHLLIYLRESLHIYLLT